MVVGGCVCGVGGGGGFGWGLVICTQLSFPSRGRLRCWPRPTCAVDCPLPIRGSCTGWTRTGWFGTRPLRFGTTDTTPSRVSGSCAGGLPRLLQPSGTFTSTGARVTRVSTDSCGVRRVWCVISDVWFMACGVLLVWVCCYVMCCVVHGVWLWCMFVYFGVCVRKCVSGCKRLSVYIGRVISDPMACHWRSWATTKRHWPCLLWYAPDAGSSSRSTTSPTTAPCVTVVACRRRLPPSVPARHNPRRRCRCQRRRQRCLPFPRCQR